MDPNSRAPKKNTSYGNEVLPQGTTHLVQRPCYQRRSPCQDPAGNRTTRRPPDQRKETQTAMVWWCLLFIKSGKKHLAWHSERGKKTRQTEEEVGRQHQGMDSPEVRQVPEGSGEQRQMERKLVMKSSVVPKRPLRLRDRWWRWLWFQLNIFLFLGLLVQRTHYSEAVADTHGWRCLLLVVVVGLLEKFHLSSFSERQSKRPLFLFSLFQLTFCASKSCMYEI